MHRRPEFSFPGSPARGPNDRLLPPRPPVNATAPRPREEEEVRWLQASLQASPDNYYHNSSSGTPSPQLWSASHHHGHDVNHRQYPASAGSSPSRAQAIAGYRREMLDLVRGLPESAYELSLRDIVEHHHRPPSSSSPSAPLPTPPPPPPPPPSSSDAGASAVRGHEAANTAATAADEQSAKQSKKQGRNKQGRAAMRRQRSRSLERSVSLDTGLLIKFFMPLSIAGRGGKKKVSPKPDAKDAKKKKKQSDKRKEEPRQQLQEEEWWSKGEFSEAGSSTRTSSTGSSNSNSSAGGSSVRNGGSNPPKAPVRSRSRKRNGCYAFFRANKSKNGVSQD